MRSTAMISLIVLILLVFAVVSHTRMLVASHVADVKDSMVDSLTDKLVDVLPANATSDLIVSGNVTPTYHTFEEFLEYPFTARCAMPICAIEFDFVHALLNESDDDWKLSIEKHGVKVQERHTSQSRCLLVRAFAEFPDVEPDVVLYNLVNFTARQEWDDILGAYESVEKVSQNSDIVYFMLPLPMVKNRDFVLQQRIKVENESEGIGYAILQRSAEHASKPRVGHRVRGENHIGGSIIRRAPGSNATHFLMAGMTDPCGVLPKWLVNMFTSKQTYDVIDKLKTASSKVQAAAIQDPSLRVSISECSGRFHQQSF